LIYRDKVQSISHHTNLFSTNFRRSPKGWNNWFGSNLQQTKYAVKIATNKICYADCNKHNKLCRLQQAKYAYADCNKHNMLRRLQQLYL